jgi:hypothetical protein
VSYNVAPKLCLHASNFSSFLNNEGMPAERKKVLQFGEPEGAASDFCAHDRDAVRGAA